jgi:hypothetical protein
MSKCDLEFDASINGKDYHIRVLEIQGAEPDVGIMSDGAVDIQVIEAESGIDVTETLPSEDIDKCFHKANEYIRDARISEADEYDWPEGI